MKYVNDLLQESTGFTEFVVGREEVHGGVDEVDILESFGLSAEEVVEVDGIDGDVFEVDLAELLVFVGDEGLVGGRG